MGVGGCEWVWVWECVGVGVGVIVFLLHSENEFPVFHAKAFVK